MTATRTPTTLGAYYHRDAEAFGVRRTWFALLASALGAMPLFEMFTDIGWLIDVWLTMLVVLGPALYLRRRHPPSAGQVWIGLVLLVPWLTLRFVSSHALLGIIPLGGTWHDVGAMITDLHRTAANDVAPVHTTPAIELTLCAMLGLLAALVDLIAVVGRHGALAGVPLLVVYTVSGAVPREPVSWWLFAIAATGFLILLSLDSSDEVSRWGHHVPRPGQARSRAVLAVSGQRIAAIAVAVAVMLPLIVPSASGNIFARLFHGGSGGGSGSGFGTGGGGKIDPFVALKGQLQRPHTQNLFSVTVHRTSGSSTGPQIFYARENVLTNFVETGWGPGDHGDTEPLTDTRYEASPGTPYQPRTIGFDATFSISGLSSNAPVFATPTNLSGLSDGTRWSPQDQLLTGSLVHKGEHFEEAVSQADPTPADFEAATATNPALKPWLQLPAIAASVRTMTANLVAGKTTPYDRARAVFDYFTDPANGFKYSLTTGAGDSGDALVDFLTNKVGYCQQYAAAMAVMLRLAHVPSRVVLGYTHPLPDKNGTFTVTTDDAHAWVEAYFDGLGWIPFDPTPLASIADGAANDLNWAPHAKPSQTDTSVPTNNAGSNRALGGHTSRPPADPAQSTSHHATSSSGWSLVLDLLGAVVLLLVLGLIPWAARQRRRRTRLRRARHGDPDALWAELSATATDLGYVWSAARTPRQVAQWLDGPSGAASDSLRTLASAVERSRYAPAGTPDATMLTGELSAVEEGLRTGQGTRVRLRARFWPASLGWTWIGPRRRRH